MWISIEVLESMEQYKKINMDGENTRGNVDCLGSNLIFENRIVPEYITTRLAANFLGISENALRIKVCRGQVPVHKLGRSLRFRISEITQLFKREE